MECTNAEVKRKLATVLSAELDDWVDKLPVVEFALNAVPRVSNLSPFFMAHGYHPDPIRLREPAREDTPQSPAQIGEQIAARFQKSIDWAETMMHASQQEMERQANRHRTPAPIYKPGDWVWLHLRREGTGRKLRDRQGKYQVLEKISSHNYRLDIPGQAHSVFHVDLLRPTANDPLPSQIIHDNQPDPIKNATPDALSVPHPPKAHLAILVSRMRMARVEARMQEGARAEGQTQRIRDGRDGKDRRDGGEGEEGDNVVV